MLAGITLGTLCFFSCATLPQGVSAVKPFDVTQYVGKWYEIARLDFYFERNLSNTTANYSLNKDGTIKVLNEGYDYTKGNWKESNGKARFIGDPMEGRLEVSFFGPFFNPYTILALEGDYEYALVAGSSLKTLWLLSRERTIPTEIKDRFIDIAQGYGYDTEELIWVEHNKY